MYEYYREKLRDNHFGEFKSQAIINRLALD